MRIPQGRGRAPDWSVDIVASGYQDRKMLKWLPFEALEPQREALRKVFGKNLEETRPEISEDQARANQYRLEEALRSGEAVGIRHFENGARHTLFTRITGIDPVRRLVRTEDGTFESGEIIEID